MLPGPRLVQEGVDVVQFFGVVHLCANQPVSGRFPADVASVACWHDSRRAATI